MRRVFLALLLSGCASAPISLTYTPGGPGVDPELSSVEIRPEAYGRVCYAVTVAPDGTLEIVVAQDGTSDWVGLRILPSILPQIVGALLAVVEAPLEILQAAFGGPGEPPLPPSQGSACSAIFEE
jgi:hypothetical protein